MGESVHERLFRLGMQRAAARSAAGDPQPWSQSLPLTQREARTERASSGRVSAGVQLHDDACRREACTRQRRETAPAAPARELALVGASGGGREGSGGWRASGGGRNPRSGSPSNRSCSPRHAIYDGPWTQGSFLDRQEAYLLRKEEKIRRQHVAKEEAQREEFQKHCTCK